MAKPGGINVKKRGMYGPGFESFELVLRPMGSLWHARTPAVREGGRRGPRTSFVRSPSFALGLHLNVRRMGFVRYETAPGVALEGRRLAVAFAGFASEAVVGWRGGDCASCKAA
jgi:hypothetical protein